MLRLLSTALLKNASEQLFFINPLRSLYQPNFSRIISHKPAKYFSLSSREASPFTPKKVLIVSKVTLLNHESRKAFRRPWRSLSHEEKGSLSKSLQDLGFSIDELVESHGEQLFSFEDTW